MMLGNCLGPAIGNLVIGSGADGHPVAVWNILYVSAGQFYLCALITALCLPKHLDEDDIQDLIHERDRRQRLEHLELAERDSAELRDVAPRGAGEAGVVSQRATPLQQYAAGTDARRASYAGLEGCFAFTTTDQ